MAKGVANVAASLYDGNIDINFDCSGVMSCRFALCSEMPPSGNETCVYDSYTCWHTDARIAALKNLKDRLVKKIKELEVEVQITDPDDCPDEDEDE